MNSIKSLLKIYKYFLTTGWYGTAGDRGPTTEMLCIKRASMKAREWLERGLEGRDPIDLLTDSWRGFNNLFYQYDGDIEREKIKNF